MVTYSLSTWCRGKKYDWRSEGGRWGWEGLRLLLPLTCLFPSSHQCQDLVDEVKHPCQHHELPSSLALLLTLPSLLSSSVECLLFLVATQHISHLIFPCIIGKLIHAYFCRCCSFCLESLSSPLALISMCLYSPVQGMLCSGNPSTV